MTGTALAVQSGLALLPASADPTQWDDREKAIMEAIGVMGTRRVNHNGQWQDERFQAPRAVVEMYLSQSRRLQLDPMAKQIYCIERGGKWGIQTSIDGFRLIADRSGKYKGQTPMEWCGPDGLWVDVWLQKEPPAASRVGVIREDFEKPIYGIATYQGYCPRDRQGALKPTNQWQTNPSNQLAKCAEMLALRKAFPQDLSGLYGAEEMDQSEPVDITATTNVYAPGEGPQVAPEQTPPEAPSDEALAVWGEWKEAIDAAADKKALAALWREAQPIVNNPIPGDPQGRKVGDYFMMTAAQLPDSVDEGTGEVQGGAEPPAEAPSEPEVPKPATKSRTSRAKAQAPAEAPTEPQEKVTEWETRQPPAEADPVGDDVPF